MKEISRNPSFTPSPKLRAHLNGHREGVTKRLNTLFDRFDHLVLTQSLLLEPDEKQVLLNILSGSFVEPSFIEHLAQEVADSDDYLSGSGAARTLYDKCAGASYPALLATVERLGF
ncbi:hypothetical protein EJN23_17610 [Salmonella enterica]|nr:hypothetical protein [Salmonella enterica]